jgi:hypothetical protein
MAEFMRNNKKFRFCSGTKLIYFTKLTQRPAAKPMRTSGEPAG